MQIKKKNPKLKKRMKIQILEINDDIKSEDNNAINNKDISDPYIFIMKDEEENEKSQIYRRTFKECYYLRCTDINCLGTAKYNIVNEQIESNRNRPLNMMTIHI